MMPGQLLSRCVSPEVMLIRVISEEWCHLSQDMVISSTQFVYEFQAMFVYEL
jgi:hypothetical protein